MRFAPIFLGFVFLTSLLWAQPLQAQEDDRNNLFVELGVSNTPTMDVSSVMASVHAGWRFPRGLEAGILAGGLLTERWGDLQMPERFGNQFYAGPQVGYSRYLPARDPNFPVGLFARGFAGVGSTDYHPPGEEMESLNGAIYVLEPVVGIRVGAGEFEGRVGAGYRMQHVSMLDELIHSGVVTLRLRYYP